jgi:hypothetical protein
MNVGPIIVSKKAAGRPCQLTMSSNEIWAGFSILRGIGTISLISAMLPERGVD